MANAHPTHDQRPWGSFTVLDHGAGYKVKRIEVLAGKRLSYQRHEHRSEHWFVVQGTGTVVLNDELHTVTTGRSIDIPKGAWHRIGNEGAERLVFVEIQRGNYLGEDDIERKQDDFGRQ